MEVIEMKQFGGKASPARPHNQSHQSSKDRSSESEDGYRRTLIITKSPHQNWGFTLQTYVIRRQSTDELTTVTFVDYVEIGGRAHYGGLRKGDILLEVNGKRLEHLTHAEVVSKIKTSSKIIRLMVYFDDCCRKIDLHYKRTKLKEIIMEKAFELRSLEEQEQRVLNGLPRFQSRPSLEHLLSTQVDIHVEPSSPIHNQSTSDTQSDAVSHISGGSSSSGDTLSAHEQDFPEMQVSWNTIASCLWPSVFPKDFIHPRRGSVSAVQEMYRLRSYSQEAPKVDFGINTEDSSGDDIKDDPLFESRESGSFKTRLRSYSAFHDENVELLRSCQERLKRRLTVHSEYPRKPYLPGAIESTQETELSENGSLPGQPAENLAPISPRPASAYARIATEQTKPVQTKHAETKPVQTKPVNARNQLLRRLACGCTISADRLRTDHSNNAPLNEITECCHF